MSDEQRPKTGAERQRALRERKKLGLVVPRAPKDKQPRHSHGTATAQPQQPREPAMPDLGNDDDPDDDVTVTRLNAYMRRCFFQAFTEVGATGYLKRVANKSPGVFLRFGQQFVTRDETVSPALRIFVQKLTLETAGPVSGVICSPIAAHISPPRYLPGPPTGEVIDAEPSDG